MENGDKRVSGSDLGEERNVENEVFEAKVEDGLELGSGETADLEEVSAQASESQEKLRELGEKTELGAGFMTIGDSGSMTVNENSSTETFEEAIGIPVALESPEELVAVVSGEKEEHLVGVESIDKIDEGGTSSEVGSDEPIGRKNVPWNGETEVSKAGNEEAHNWEASGGKILPEDGKIEELKDNLDAEYQKNRGLADVSIELQPVEDEGPSEILAVLDIDDWDNKGEKLTGDATVLDSGNGHHIPVALGSPEEFVTVVREEKEEHLVGVESIDKIDEGGTSSEVGSDEPSGRKDVPRSGETEVSKAGNEEAHNWEALGGKILPEDGKIEELKDNSDAEYQKNRGLADVSIELQPVEDEGPSEILAVLDIDDWDNKGEKLTGDATVLDSGNGHHIPVALGSPGELVAVVHEEKEEHLVGVESIDKIDEGGTSSEVGSDEPSGKKDVPWSGETEVSKAGNEEAHNWEASGGKILPEDGKTEELKDNLDAEYQKNRGLANVSIELQPVEDEGPSEILAVLDIDDWDNKGEKLTGDATVLDSGDGHHIDENLSVDQEGKNLGVQGDSNGDVKDSSVAENWEHNQQSYESKTTSAVIHKFVEEPAVIAETLSPLSSEKFVNGKNEEVRPYAANLGGEDRESSKLLQAGERAIEVEKNRGETKHLENKVENSSGDCKIHSAPNSASSSGRSINTTPSSARPAGLGHAAPLLESAPRVTQPTPRVNGTVSHKQLQVEETTSGEAGEYDETREKLQMIRVKFLRLAHRLGQTPHNVVVAQVLYRLGLAEQLRGRNGGPIGAFSFDRASAMAEQLEAAGREPLDFSCTIMVIGKTGVGKSATINSIFDELKFGTDAFQLSTKKVEDVVGTVQGIKVRVIDTPGLLPSCSDQRQNEKILHSIKRFIKRMPPDIVLYLDRLDMQSRDFGDMPLLRTITEIFGPSIWFNAIIALTHAASAPPDGPNGTASSYDMFVTQRSHVVQQAIRQAAGDMRLMNPVSLVENHTACRTNRAGQRVLPNGQVWKPHLLLLSFASKILAEANALLKLQDSPSGKPFATRSRALPLPFLLSSLLQSRPQVKLPEEQFGDEDDLGDDLDETSDSEFVSEYDDLPPFKSLTKAQLAKLTKSQKKAYFDELELREKLLMQKQLKEEKRRRKMMKKMAAAAKDLPSDHAENAEEESGGAASVPVPMPDLALPASFDSDYPTHRYRCLDSSNQWLIRPVLETHGWDHDVGYEGLNAERLFVVKQKVPVSFSGQVMKDKKDANVQMELASSIKHGDGKATSLGFDLQSVGKDLAYTLRSETRFSNFRKNKATAGLSVTLMGDALSGGVKVEDKLVLNKRFQMVLSGGAMIGRGDLACGGSLEAQLQDKDYPLGRSLSTLGLSVMDWHGDLAVGCNIQSQVPIGRSTNLVARANLNNKGAGQISVRVNSSEQLQIALIALVPLFKKLFSYPQQMQYGQ